MLARCEARQIDPDHCPPPEVVSTANHWQDSALTVFTRYAVWLNLRPTTNYTYSGSFNTSF